MLSRVRRPLREAPLPTAPRPRLTPVPGTPRREACCRRPPDRSPRAAPTRSDLLALLGQEPPKELLADAIALLTGEVDESGDLRRDVRLLFERHRPAIIVKRRLRVSTPGMRIGPSLSSR